MPTQKMKIMKKIIVVALAAISIVSCSKVGKNEYLISGDAKGMPNGEMIILQVQDSSGMPKSLDTVKIKDGKFEIKGKVESPELAYVFFPKKSNGFSLILEEGELKAAVNKDSINTTVVKGSPNNDEFSKIFPQLKKFGEEKSKFMASNQERYQKAMQERNMAELEKINQEMMNVYEKASKYSKDYIAKNQKSFISLLLVSNIVKVEEAEKAFNGLDESIKKTKFGKQLKDGLAKAKKQEEAVKATPVPAPEAAPVQ